MTGQNLVSIALKIHIRTKGLTGYSARDDLGDSYRCMMVASAKTASMIANRIPRQSRGPAENGTLTM